jgi:hypothetical protein
MAFTALVAVGVGACGEAPSGPEAAGSPQLAKGLGTGIVLDNLTGLTLPGLGLELGDVKINQAIITDLKVVEDVVSGLAGLEATGVLELTGGVLGTNVVEQNFTTTLGVTSSGPGQCGVVSLNLGPITVDRLEPVANVDLPATDVDVSGSGAVGPLLCALSPLLNAPGNAIEAIVRALNRLI